MKKVVVIGGGSGNFILLKGLKKYTNELTAIFTMFDSGGSTGVLRDEFGYLPPGDIRRGILALAPESNENKILRDLFNYRFNKGNGFNGHNFGNILLTVLKDITGDELAAIDEASKLFNIKGKVLPITLDNAHLCAELENGEIIQGETNIDIPKHNTSIKIKRVFLSSKTYILPDTREAILNAETIVLGPGDIFTSVIPCLLVDGVVEAIKQSKAKKIYVCNIMTKNGESNDFKASDFLEVIEKYLGKEIVTHFIVNSEPVSKDLLINYTKENATQVVIDDKLYSREDIKIIKEDLINTKDIVRHESNKLAKVIIEI